MLGTFIKTVLGQAVVVAVLFAGVIGPFMLLKFDHAVYLVGALIVVAIAFIYWPRRPRDED